jgi:hypothetical protein
MSVANFLDSMVIKPASVFNAFGEGISYMLVRYTANTNGISIIIKAEDTRMRFDIVNSSIGIQGDKRDHAPLVKESVSGIVVHGAVSKKVFEGD